MGSKISKNLQIGNAVPPIFGLVIAQEIVRALGQIHPDTTPLEACARAMTYISDSVWESMERDAKKSAKVLREIEDADAEYAA